VLGTLEAMCREAKEREREECLYICVCAYLSLTNVTPMLTGQAQPSKPYSFFGSFQ